MADVWILEDHAPTRRTFARALTRLGLAVRVFGSAQDAEEPIRAEPAPHGLLLDHRLRGEPGVSWGERHAPRLQQTELVVVTGNADPELTVRTYKLGGRVVHKPVERSFFGLFAAAVRGRASCALGSTGSSLTARQAERFAAFARKCTAQQCAVLALHVRGLSTKEIATKLGLSTDTIRSHNHDILVRLGVGEMREVVRRILAEP